MRVEEGTFFKQDFTSNWGEWNGTSFAAPKVAAAIAKRASGFCRTQRGQHCRTHTSTSKIPTTCSGSSSASRISPEDGGNGPRRARTAAGAGDQAAWNAIVERFRGLVWATARAHRLSHADAADVAQTTWLRLVEHLDRIRDAERLGGWLATTARNECLRCIRLHGRELPSDEADVFESPDDDAPEVALLIDERDTALWRAFAS